MAMPNEPRNNNQTIWRAPKSIIILVILGIVASLQVFFSVPSNNNSNKKSSSDIRVSSSNAQACKNASNAIGVIVADPSASIIALGDSDDLAALMPGELPGYTGWARPATTLAGHFDIVSVTPSNPVAGDIVQIIIECKPGSKECNDATTAFYLRAYGPAVVPGFVTTDSQENSNNNDGKQKQYRFNFHFAKRGSYTVEAVVSFSKMPPIDAFPLSNSAAQADFEGYLVKGFPFLLRVAQDGQEGQQQPEHKKRICNVTDLTLPRYVAGRSSSSSSIPAQQESPAALAAMKIQAITQKASWHVVSKYGLTTIDDNDKHNNNNDAISVQRYKHGFNSINVQMSYEFNDCKLLSHETFASLQKQLFLTTNNKCKARNKNNKSNQLQIIMIGDSVMRIQKDMFVNNFARDDQSNIHVTFLELYGGYRRVVTTNKPINLRAHLRKLQSNDDTKIVIFNTGLHDIHRLCGQEWDADRREYMKSDSNNHIRCTYEYRKVINDFADLLDTIPFDMKIFQLTSAGWPKYGNFGFEWPIHGGQALPLAPEFAAHFNEIAVTILQRRNDVHIVDGYWVTYARPDNREIGEDNNAIGHKLSHPGLEVQSAMVRMWMQLIMC